jgi:hypothetical protein
MPVALVAFGLFIALMDSYSSEVFRVSGMPRLFALLSLFVAGGTATGLFAAMWLWFDGRRRY